MTSTLAAVPPTSFASADVETIGEAPAQAQAWTDALLPPSLQINPIGSAYRPVSAWTSLGVSVVVWGLLGAGCLLAYRAQVSRKAALVPTEAVNLLLSETEHLTLDGGGHQGGGPAPKPKAPEPEPAKPSPPPPPAQRDFPTDVAVPSALPSEPIQAPPAPAVLGVAGGTGTGSGFGTGSGSGTGTGSGTGSGNGSGPGVQSKDAEPLLVPYSQIGFVKVVNPNYPELARRVGLQGQVVVRVTIDENGVPFAFHVLGGEELFVKETLRVLPRWRFTPVLHDGRKVRATFDAILRFNLA